MKTSAEMTMHVEPDASTAKAPGDFARKLAKRRALLLRLEEAQWARIVDALPDSLAARSRNHATSGSRVDPVRNFVEGVLWVAHTRAYWYQMPADYGNGHAIYVRFTRWAQRGCWKPVIYTLPEGSELRERLASLVTRHLETRWMRKLSRELSA